MLNNKKTFFIIFTIFSFSISFYAFSQSVITPKKFVYDYKKAGMWLAVNISGIPSDNKLLNRLQTISIPLIKAENKNRCSIDSFWQGILLKSIKEKLDDKQLLIYSNNGIGYEEVSLFLKDNNFPASRVFFLKGGLSSFNKYYERLKKTNLALYDKVECNCE